MTKLALTGNIWDVTNQVSVFYSVWEGLVETLEVTELWLLNIDLYVNAQGALWGRKL
jgi:hypothetical protein